jgi:hypothetical protein
MGIRFDTVTRMRSVYRTEARTGINHRHSTSAEGEPVLPWATKKLGAAC